MSHVTKYFLIASKQIRFPIGGERVTCCWSKFTKSPRQGEQNSLTPQANNNLNFRLARDQVLLLEIAANLRANLAPNIILELGDITKHLMTGPAGNSEF